MEARARALPAVSQLRSPLAARTWGVLSSTWTLGILVFVATWGGGATAPAPGLDLSSHTGFRLAAELGLEHGDDLVFSYGPLGFLKSYLLLGGALAQLATLYGIALHLALSLSLVWVARRSFPLLIALALALVAAMLLRGDMSAIAVREDAAVLVLVFIWCVVALGSSAPPWARRLVAYAGGPVAAIELLAKPNTGLAVLALLTLTVVAIEQERRRNVVVFAASFAGALAALWFAGGQGLGNVGSYLDGTIEIVSGYSSGARLEWNNRTFDDVLAPGVVAIAFGIAWVSTHDLGPRRRALILGMLAFVAFASFKAGFVRHDVFHVATFYSTILGACLAFRLPSRREPRLVALVAIAGVAAAGFTAEFSGYPMTNPIENARNGASTLETLVSSGKRQEEVEAARVGMKAEYGVDRQSLELLEGRGVHVEPSEVGAAWAYELDWRPPPVFQPYAAYTQELDHTNAAALASDSGPERILRERGTLLDRYPGFESPAAMLEILCNYRALRTAGRWQVLGRVRDRCGQPMPLETVEARYGEPVRVPVARGNRAVLARVHGAEVSGLERVRAFFHRAHSRHIRFDAGRLFAVVPGTAADGLLLRAPARIDFPRPFELAPNAREITLLLNERPSGDRLRIEFYAMPVAPVANEARASGAGS